MRMFRLPILILLAFASILAPLPRAQAGPTSFADMVTFASSTGRLTFEVWGDSTVERSGSGHSVGFAKGLFGVAPCAGQFMPVNTTAAFGNTSGIIEARRRANPSTKSGGVNDISVDTTYGYPASFKQYGCQIPAIGGYIGPQVAYLAGTTINGGAAVTNVSTTDITVVSTAGFPNNGRIRIDNEIIQYGSKTATTFSSTISRGNLGSLAAAHADGSVVGLCDNGSFFGAMLFPARHPIGSGTSFVQSLFYMSAINTSAAACAEARLSFDTTVTPVNTDSTYTNLLKTTINGGSAVTSSSTTDITVVSTSTFPSSGTLLIDNELIAYTSKTATTFSGITRGARGTGGTAQAAHSNGATVIPGACFDLGNASYAIGSLHRVDLAYSGSDLTNTEQVTLNFGCQTAINGLGPAGPAAFMYTGLFAANRPYGGIQSEGDSQGGKTIDFLLKTLRVYDVTNATCEYDAGLVNRYKLFGGDTTVGAAASALGGNQIAGFCQVMCTGHNESSNAATADTALVDPTEAWTIARQTAINGGVAVTSSSTTAITVGSTSGSPAAGCVLIGSEYIGYTSITATTYAGTITRGMYGTVPAAHADASVVYQGDLILSPVGIATDLLFDYKQKRAAWVTAGGNANYFWYIWVRPIPISATKTVIDDHTAINGADPQATQYAQKEYRFDRYASVIGAYLGNRPGFIVADMSLVFAGGDALTYDLGVLPGASGDQVHNSNATYNQAWHRYFAKYGYSPARSPLRDRSPRRRKPGVSRRVRRSRAVLK